MADPNVTLTALNEANQQAIVYVGTQTTLDISLVNKSDPIILNSGNPASSMEIFMPNFFTADDVGKMGVSLQDWTFSKNPAGPSLVLTYAGTDRASWGTGHKIDFKITSVQSSGQPGSDAVQVNFNDMGGNVPVQVQTPLSLSNPPKPGNASLRDVLQVSLDSQGSVYVSTETDPLQNTLFLNLKNIGDTDLYTGSTQWSVTPQVKVTFVYGSTSGALAPDDNAGPPIGSAWNIVGGIEVDQTAGWSIRRSSKTDQDPHPKWLLEPVLTNPAILGTGDEANVTFDFSQIVSLTSPGHTQAVVNFSGFWKDEKTQYDDAVFTLDIVKQEPPPTRGLINFFGESPVINVTDPTKQISVGLRWAMFDVAKVNLICSFPGMKPVEKKYPNPTPLDYDNYTFNIPGTKESGAVFFTLQAFDGNNAYLNSMQFAVFLSALMFVDGRDGRVYPVVLLNNQLWMAENLAHDDGAESYSYNNLPVNEKSYGRLYTARADSSTRSPSAGWRIPSKKDWQGLFDKYGDGNAAYAALIDGGASGFGAKLGGSRDDGGGFSSLTISGFYRTSEVGGLYAGFSSKSKSVNLVATFPSTYALSIRYVRDL